LYYNHFVVVVVVVVVVVLLLLLLLLLLQAHPFGLLRFTINFEGINPLEFDSAFYTGEEGGPLQYSILVLQVFLTRIILIWISKR
jgi:hypothetical protein